MLTALATALARNLRVASLVVAAAMIGVGGAAATVVTVADSTPSADPSVTVTADNADDSADDQGEDADDQGEDADDQGEDADEVEAVETESTEDATELATEAAEAAPVAPVAPVTAVACADATTHGEYVSSVARSTQGMPEHSTLVKAAAQSDCGKTEVTETTTEGTATTAAPQTETAAPTTHGKSAEAHGKSAGPHGKSADHRGLHGKSAGKAKHNR